MNCIEEAKDRAEKIARVEAIEKAASDAKRKHEEHVAAQTSGHNERYFEKQRLLEEQIAANKPIVLKPQTNADAIAAEQARYPRPAVNPPQTGYLDAASTVEAPRKPSITLQPMPSKYPSGDPRAGLTEALILSFNMDPEPTHPPFAKK
jgi:hypothetical protein